jgi:exosortase/archaeosortase family protein
VLRFWATALPLVVLSHPLLESEVVWRAFREDYGRLLTRLAGALLSPFAGPLLVEETLLAGTTFGASVARSCDGLNATAIVLALMTAYPARVRQKLVGMVGAVVAIAGFNVLRIVALFLVGAHSRALFEGLHVYAFQVSIVAAGAACFFAWARAIEARRAI